MMNSRGSTQLALAVAISAGVTIVSMATLSLIGGSTQTSFDLIRKRQSVFAAEGGIRIVQKLSQQYFGQTLAPSSTELVEYVRPHVQNLKIGGFTFDDVEAEIKAEGDTVIPSGPFMGMHTRVHTVKFGLRATDTHNRVSSSVHQESVLGMIKLFQFFLFSDQYTEWYPGPPQNVIGRVHVNDTICIGGANGFLHLENITAAGHIYLIDNPNCRTRVNSPKARIFDGSNYVQLLKNADSGCTNCGGTGKSWRDYSAERWQGRLQDVAHEVPRLRLPGIGTTAPAQDGRDSAGQPISNMGTMRPLVDPVLPGEELLIKETKFAYQADIRIINGVWYLKDPSDPQVWPGMPIWSDHPGRFTTWNEENIEGVQNVGQEDLRTARGWGSSTPQYYSFYEYDPVNARLTGDNFGVVSYGNLYRDASGGNEVWKPGHWVSNTGNNFCTANPFCSNCFNGIMPASTSLQCQGGVGTLHTSVGYLNATRGGFLNGHAEAAPTGNAGFARQLPMNFDLQQFQLALQQTGVGELGSYFGSGSYFDREFNGIIYITNTWPGALRGIDGTNVPVAAPTQGSQPDASQPNTITGLQRALPFQLCSSNLANQSFAGTNGRFRIPSCASYQGPSPAIAARPNVIRIINGADVDTSLLSKGLTIASNLPVYVQGNFNTSSDVSTAIATPWKPILIAGDFISHLSRAWNDERSRWGAAYVLRRAERTTYNHSILAGYLIQAHNGGPISGAGVNTFTRYNEDWSNIDHIVNGSFVIGFSSVYFYFANICCNNRTYQAPNRTWVYDPHLYNFNNQPPGTPTFYVYAIKDWYSGSQ